MLYTNTYELITYHYMVNKLNNKITCGVPDCEPALD